jgi:hypothetical protein|tara:strand:+ start:9099 stop:10361 length:1263 start_codon:yes stop_codon:yes gene_type:complete
MADKKSILEEALLDINKIQEALNANTKEILRSVAKEEIDGVVKESLNMGNQQEEYVEEDLDNPETDFDIEDGASDELGLDGGEEDEMGMSDEMDLDSMEDSEEVGPEMEPELGMDADALGGDDMDMTASSDDEVIAIYKKLSGEDEIEIVGDDIHLNITEPGEYVVKMNGATGGGMEDDMGTEMDSELDLDGLGDEESEDDVDYEIEMGDEEGEEDIESDETPEFETSEGEDEESEEAGEEEEEEVEELDETKYVGGKVKYVGTSHDNAKLQTEAQAAKKLVSETITKYNTILTEAKKLKAENEEFRKALKEFRTKLVETVVFNSNLTYVTRILMEHSTTKAEKQNIIKRFDDEVSNLKESKNLYKSIVNGLDSRKPMNEAIESKLIKEVTTGSSKQLNESTAYVDPSTKRIIDLMKRVG